MHDNNPRGCGCLKYVAFLANKYDVDPYDFLKSFIKAEKKQIANCGPLKILLRERARGYAIFQLKKGSKIISQFKMKSSVWRNPTKTNNIYSILLKNLAKTRIRENKLFLIKNLHLGMKKVNLKVKVAEKSKVMLKHSRYDGHLVRLCIATVTDSSGSISLPLWNYQIEEISVGDELEVKNASVKKFNGSLYVVPARKKGELVTVAPKIQ